MKIIREVIDAVKIRRNDVDWWMVTTQNPDGSRYAYALPSFTFENLSVEYGFDPDDIDSLLDIAIHQLHIPPLEDLPDDEDPAFQKGISVSGGKAHFGNAPTSETAKAAHLERVKWVKENMVEVRFPEKSGQKRMVNRMDLSTDEDVEVDPHNRLEILKQSYKPDAKRMNRYRSRIISEFNRRSGNAV